MKWVRVAVNIGTDPSVGIIADALGVRRSHAVGLCTLVFVQMPEHARNGDLSGVSASTLETWAGWHGKKGAFAAAFRAHLCTPEGLVKAWDKHNGAAIRESDATRERVANLRKNARATGDVRRTVGVTSGSDVTGRDGTGRDGKKDAEVVIPERREAAATLAAHFTTAGQRNAYLGYRADAKLPARFDDCLEAVRAAHTGGAQFEWSTIGKALVEMAGVGVVFSPAALRAFCSRIIGPSSTTARGGGSPVVDKASWKSDLCEFCVARTEHSGKRLEVIHVADCPHALQPLAAGAA